MRTVRPTASGADASSGDHRDPFGARTVVLRQERPADRGPDAEHLKVVAGDDLAHREPRAVIQVERREHRAVAGDVFEDVVLGAKIEIVRVRGRAERPEPRGAREHVDQAIGRRDRQRLEQQRVDDREERGVETDADCQRRDGDQREPRALSQPAQRVTDVREK
jgi:hypothetical protein